MLFAFDYHDNRVHIDDTQSNQEYFCPYCGTPLIVKKGDVRQHHFAHKSHRLCTDTWVQNRSYDLSPWHNDWQGCYPKENQEVLLTLGNTKHRADVLTGKTVIEFQHSIMAPQSFDDRNNFYFNLGYKVIWLFDLTDLLENGHITSSPIENGLKFIWKNPKKAFNSYDIKTGCIDLFFQIREDENSSIVRVTDVSASGFEEFYTSQLMSKTAFLEYTGLVNGVCPPPDRDDWSTNAEYLAFKKKYDIRLNKQQERALQAVEGSNLLLAVPGSGKTTVLVDRLGYMILEKKINPQSILAITFNKRAAEEMATRFTNKFGRHFGAQIRFRTINSLALEIYLHSNISNRRRIEEKEKKALCRNIYKKFHENEYPSENDIMELETGITYAKNMILSEAQIKKFDTSFPQFSQMHQDYQMHLKSNDMMDFDDQMVFANWILDNKPDQLAYWQKRYKYICVDEAQDTSKIQHEIIHKIANGNNIFMVGDEDQSIYGFRGAYPKALLNFRIDYTNPYILRMERNYRSTKQIVEKAQAFISMNKGRYEKNMVADRGDGEPVKLIDVVDVEEQYQSVLESVKEEQCSTAILFRDNSSSVVLVDYLLRNQIDFNLKKPEMNFFGNNIVRDIIAYLTISVNPYSYQSFSQICNHGIIYMKKQQKDYAIKNCKSRNVTIFDALDEQMQYVSHDKKHRSADFRSVMNEVSKVSSWEAINILLQSGYRQYLEKENRDFSKVEALSILAKQEPDKAKFLARLTELENLITSGFSGSKNCALTLSTIHSSKGLEYDSVYMVDIYDGRFPSERSNTFNISKDSSDIEQEERRLFYVGITRAKNKLILFNIKNRHSSFIDDLFPEIRKERIKLEKEKEQKIYNDLEEYKRTLNQRTQESQRSFQEEVQRHREELRQAALTKRQAEEAARQKAAHEEYTNRYNEVKHQFVQQEKQILDSRGVRWIKCEKCGEIYPSSKFISYGGKGHINLGICEACGHHADR